MFHKWRRNNPGITGEAKAVIERCGDIPVYTAEMDILTNLTGYQLTRGLLCAMLRPTLPSLEEISKNARRIVVLESGECLLKPVYATSLLLGRYNQLSQKLGFVDDASALNARFVIEKAVFDFTSIGEDVVVERDDTGVVYDIYGRRVERVTVPGCYIVDGCKVYLRP